VVLYDRGNACRRLCQSRVFGSVVQEVGDLVEPLDAALEKVGALGKILT